MSVWSRTLVYLGLKEEPDDMAADWSTVDAGADERPAVRPASPAPATPAPALAAEHSSNVRPLRTGLDLAGDRVTVVHVRVFDDVEAIGSRYRRRHPVLFDVSTCTRETARRTVDFVSGLTYASEGRLRRTAPKAFLLVPDGVDIPLDERRRLSQLGYDVEGLTR